ncbi:MAG: site-specific integrase [bacterium]|nr:site-specific integrase [bacterium]
MAAKVRWYKNAWWLDVHHKGRRHKRRFGATKTQKQKAEAVATKVNAAIALGTFDPAGEQARPPLPVAEQLRAWHRRYKPTLKPSTQVSSLGLIDRHLAPFFGELDLRDLHRNHLLDFIQRKLDEGLSPATIQNALSILRRVCSLAVEDEVLDRNPAARVGTLIRRVTGSLASEVRQADAWTEQEVATLLEVAARRDRWISEARGPQDKDRASDPSYRAARLRLHERPFYPLLHFAFSTGCRKGEILGLQWADIDLGNRRITIRRALVRGEPTTPKSGRARPVMIPVGLAEMLLDLQGERRREIIARGWKEVPPWVFCDARGGPLNERNFTRSWDRIRREAVEKHRVRKLPFHTTRHTYASRAIAAGRSVRWVAGQLGHANPELTLRVYAHWMTEAEGDLGFAEFGGIDDSGGPERPQTAPPDGDTAKAPTEDGATPRSNSDFMERETGLEPATLGLGSQVSESGKVLKPIGFS